MKVDVFNLNNKKTGDITLDPSIFCVALHSDLIKRYVVYQLAKRQSGNHSVKTLNEVNATGKKPHKQKGTGNARLGSKKAPQCRGGAVIFGPVVRSHRIEMPKKLRKLAIKSALSEKLSSGKLIVIDDLFSEKISTKLMCEKIKNFNCNSILFVDSDCVNDNFALSIRNIPKVNLIKECGINVYDILNHDFVALSKNSVELLERRL